MSGDNIASPGVAEQPPPLFLIAGLLITIVITTGLIWLVGDQAALAAAYAGGLAVISLAIWGAARLRPTIQIAEPGVPDWSVTVAAIDNPDQAIAITDRAGRLTCANSNFSGHFGSGHAPPDLPFDDKSREILQHVGKSAWREGFALADGLHEPVSGRRWQVQAERAGRGEDYLVWRLFEIIAPKVEELLVSRLRGPLGTVLSRAGVEGALVGPDGIVQVATPGLAERATGEAETSLEGVEFTQLLRMDDRDRIFFAREGQQGTPQLLVHVPLDPMGNEETSYADEESSLMLLVDSGVGIGAGLESSTRSATPQLEALLSALPLGLALTDRDGRFLFANKAFLRAVGFVGKELPQYPSDLVVREDKSPLSDSVRRYAKGPASSGDMPIRLAGEPEEPVLLGLAGVRGIGEAAVLLSLNDSTEENRLRRQVAQATKMQAVGQLAGGVAHDFNNVLTAIIGYCDLMLLRHMPGDSDYDDIQQIKLNSNRAASLTRHLLAFSRQQTLRPVVLQLPDVVSEVSQLLKRLIGDRIAFRVRHDRELGPVRADPQQLEQVIINLAVNARDAILANGEGPGVLSIETRRITARDVQRMDTEIMPLHDYTALIIRDTGGGIPKEHLHKIFEPFFTTKEQGKGTGLGLSTVYGIVKQSNGFIFAENTLGPDGKTPGAAFFVYLPVHEGLPPPPQNDAHSDEEVSDWSSGGNLLLVEDEDMVRIVAQRALVRAGFTVTATADGEEGLAAVESGEGFDLVVSDVVMPGMDGPAMARAIRELRPDLPILFMSGYAEEQLRRDIDIENMHFIAKPFSVQQINAKVSGILREKARRKEMKS